MPLTEPLASVPSAPYVPRATVVPLSARYRARLGGVGFPGRTGPVWAQTTPEGVKGRQVDEYEWTWA